jgi:hypothetical protein
MTLEKEKRSKTTAKKIKRKEKENPQKEHRPAVSPHSYALPFPAITYRYKASGMTLLFAVRSLITSIKGSLSFVRSLHRAKFIQALDEFSISC